MTTACVYLLYVVAGVLLVGVVVREWRETQDQKKARALEIVNR